MIRNNFNFNLTGLNIPDTCPVCGADLEVLDNGKVRCINESCNQKIQHLIMTFFNVSEVKGAGPSYYEEAAKDCKNLYDFISNIVEGEAASVRWAGGVNGTKIQKGVMKYLSKPISVSEYLSLFDLEGFGPKKLALLNNTKFFKEFNTTDKPLDNFEVNGIALPEVTEKMEPDQKLKLKSRIESKIEDIENCRKFFTFDKNEKSVEKVEDGKLTGLSFCFTGSACKPRKELEAMVVANGGVVSSVKKGLSYLVTDDTESGSSKNVKAKQLGIPVITSLEFVSMC